MKQGTRTLESIFGDAVEIASDAERQAFVEQACAENANLRVQVEHLVEDHFRAGSFLQSPAELLETAPLRGSDDTPGTQIGPYKLLEQIGEGGMGLVFVAAQQHPVRRTVALKLIKPGMDSNHVIARFEVERQALALMDHPNIAKVLDAGTTEAGRPYFVMELVRGIPITEYCDQARMPIRQRLEVFVQVCRAVQHAHTKGVIHRDIKPTNVLVTSHDGIPVPVVIDFGVAKALGQQLTDRTLHTGFAQLVGTPLYMSPEQAEFNQLGVDTRSDVYSLGVLLYELLTGVTPFDLTRLKSVAYDEFRRILREEEAPRLSVRVSTMGKDLTTASERRGVDSRKLTKTLRGELDWIVLKALEKDRTRRYETASAFTTDVEHYLKDEPVEACPPSAGYRLRKLVRRHKVVLGTATMVAAALIAGTAVSVWQAVRAMQASRAEAEQRLRAEERTKQARDVVLDFYVRVAQEWLLDEPQLQGVRREFVERALQFSRQMLDERPVDAEAMLELARTLRVIADLEGGIGQFAEAEQHCRQAIGLFDEMRDTIQDPMRVHEGSARARLKLAGLLSHQHQYPEVEELTRQGLVDAATALSVPGGDPQRRSRLMDTVGALEDTLANIQQMTGRLEDAQQARTRQIEVYRRLVSENPSDAKAHAYLGSALHNLSLLISRQNQNDAAIRLLEEAIAHDTRATELEPRRAYWRFLMSCHLGTLSAIYKLQGQSGPSEQTRRTAVRYMERLAEDYPRNVDYSIRLADHYGELAGGLRNSKRWDEAEATYKKAISLLEQVLKESQQSADGRLFLGTHLHNLGTGQKAARSYAEAEKNLRRADEVLRALVSEAPTLNDRRTWGAVLASLGVLLRERRRYDEALPILRECLDLRRKLAEEQPKDVAAQSNLGAALDMLGVARADSGHPAEGIDLLRQALAVQERAFTARPKDPAVRRALIAHHANLACCLADASEPALRRPKEAMDHARMAIEMNPKNSFAACYFLALAQYRSGDPKAAILYLEKPRTVEQNDEDVECSNHYLLAMSYFQVGKGEQARSSFKRAETLLESVQKTEVVHPGILRIRAEAASLLGVTLSDPPKPEK
jgi:eukaryotic-like serine/threonine-protein kinase